ncbi:hypothetical protein [Microtetraspora niveoalba]|uniref:hypothetical protein n=1 Tax=Microtetraspora niveoalba TaxID=46175 RepID=UPI0012F7F498|nr:hypothetical protein [Microtetraspora niveoalba]
MPGWVNDHGAHLLDYAGGLVGPARAPFVVASVLAACRTRGEPPDGVSPAAWLLGSVRRRCRTDPEYRPGYVPGPGPGVPDLRSVERAWTLADPLGAEALRLMYRHELALADVAHVLELSVEDAGRLATRTQDLIEIMVSGMDALVHGRAACRELPPLLDVLFPEPPASPTPEEFADGRMALTAHIVGCAVCKRPINIRYTVPQMTSHPPLQRLTDESRRRLEGDADSPLPASPEAADPWDFSGPTSSSGGSWASSGSLDPGSFFEEPGRHTGRIPRPRRPPAFPGMGATGASTPPFTPPSREDPPWSLHASPGDLGAPLPPVVPPPRGGTAPKGDTSPADTGPDRTSATGAETDRMSMGDADADGKDVSTPAEDIATGTADTPADPAPTAPAGAVPDPTAADGTASDVTVWVVDASADGAKAVSTPGADDRSASTGSEDAADHDVPVTVADEQGPAADQRAGTSTTGTDAAGTHPAGTVPTGTDAVGTRSAGVVPAGTDAVGTRSAGVVPAGTDAAGTGEQPVADDALQAPRRSPRHPYAGTTKHTGDEPHRRDSTTTAHEDSGKTRRPYTGSTGDIPGEPPHATPDAPEDDTGKTRRPHTGSTGDIPGEPPHGGADAPEDGTGVSRHGPPGLLPAVPESARRSPLALPSPPDDAGAAPAGAGFDTPLYNALRTQAWAREVLARAAEAAAATQPIPITPAAPPGAAGTGDTPGKPGRTGAGPAGAPPGHRGPSASSPAPYPEPSPAAAGSAASPLAAPLPSPLPAELTGPLPAVLTGPPEERLDRARPRRPVRVRPRPLSDEPTRPVRVIPRERPLARNTSLKIAVIVLAGAAGTVTGIKILGPALDGEAPSRSLQSVAVETARSDPEALGIFDDPGAEDDQSMGSGPLRIPATVTLDEFGRGTMTITVSEGAEGTIDWRVSAPGLVVTPAKGTLKRGGRGVVSVRALRVRYWCGAPETVTAPLTVHGPSESITTTVRWRTC